MKEGWDERRIFFVGNTMIDSLFFALSKVQDAPIRVRLKLTPPMLRRRYPASSNKC